MVVNHLRNTGLFRRGGVLRRAAQTDAFAVDAQAGVPQQCPSSDAEQSRPASVVHVLLTVIATGRTRCSLAEDVAQAAAQRRPRATSLRNQVTEITSVAEGSLRVGLGQL